MEQADTRAPRNLPRSNLWLESRYRKLRRGLPQTIFYCPKCKGDRRRRRSCTHCEGFGKLTRESVQELIGRRILPRMQAKTGKFHGAGREDLDVLMLGRGRPFVYEVVGARNPAVDLEELRREIEERAEGAIELDPFVRVGKERVVYWKNTHFDKIYRVDVTIEGTPEPAALAAAAAFAGTIVQRTPQRVAHRRADLDREREVEVLELGFRAAGAQGDGEGRPEASGDGDAVELELRVRCQHGTYVKEWISGDDGRTTPSLSSLLGVPCRCRQLDVAEILTEDSAPRS